MNKPYKGNNQQPTTKDNKMTTAIKELEKLQAFKMGILCLLGTEAICIFDSSIDNARTTASKCLEEIYKDELVTCGMCDFDDAAPTAVSWFNSSPDIWLAVYRRVQEQIKSLIIDDLSYLCTHKQQAGSYKFERKVEDIIRAQMINYRDNIMEQSNLVKYAAPVNPSAVEEV